MTARWSGATAVVGVYESPRRQAAGVHPFEIHAEVIRGALADAGLERGDVDGFATAAGFPTEGGREMDVCEVAEYVGLAPRWMDATDIGGAAPISQLAHATVAIHAGLCSIAVISYAAVGRSWWLPADDLGTYAHGPGQYEVPFGPTTVANHALAARRHMHEFGTTPAQLAEVAVQCRANAAANPDARYRDPITVNDVEESPLIADPLRRLDCCVVTDSGGAIVLTSRERAAELSGAPVYVLGSGEALGQVQMNQMRDFTSTAASRSARDALQHAGMRIDEIDCGQIYDSFTITVLLTLESIGVCGRGESGAFVEEGGIGPSGRFPINTDGGGLSSNHPGRRGALAVIEGVRQLRGESPGVQLDAPATCVVNGTGGFLSATATVVLGV